MWGQADRGFNYSWESGQRQNAKERGGIVLSLGALQMGVVLEEGWRLREKDAKGLTPHRGCSSGYWGSFGGSRASTKRSAVKWHEAHRNPRVPSEWLPH